MRGLGSPEWNEGNHFRKDENEQKYGGRSVRTSHSRTKKKMDMTCPEAGKGICTDPLGVSKEGCDMVLLICEQGQ